MADKIVLSGAKIDSRASLERSPDSKANSSSQQSLSGVGAQTVWSYRLDQARTATATESLTLAGIDIVELEFDDGFRVNLPSDDFHQEVQRRQSSLREAAVDDALTVPTQWDAVGLDSAERGSERGIARWALKFLRGLKIDVAGQTALAIAGKLESRLAREAGVYHAVRRDNDAGPLALEDIDVGRVDRSRGLLILIHGVFSSSNDTFRGLTSAQDGKVWSDLVERFGRDNILALEHPTVTEGPIENALMLAEALEPFAGMAINLLTHSRGGLVGELICRGDVKNGVSPYSGAELNLFSGKDYVESRQALSDLNDLLASQPVKVERFIRVACPVRGTTLASERLDRYLAGLVTVAGNLPLLAGNIFYDTTSELLLAVAKERTKPEALPGLACMMPNSPCVRLLNAPGRDRAEAVRVDADLSSVRGDSAGSRMLNRMLVFFADLFYGEANDLVVPTRSMLGGSARSSDSAVLDFFKSGGDVNHFRYFDNHHFTSAIVERLSDRDNTLFESIPQSAEVTSESRGYNNTPPENPQGTVILLPGILGSHLGRNGSRVWLNLLELGPLGRGWRALDIDASEVTAEDVIHKVYGDLIEYLCQSHRVEIFPYDWRLSIREESKRLLPVLNRELTRSEDSGLPVSLLCHSMGGLVARSLLAHEDDLAARFRANPHNRLIMLGTPSKGSHAIVRVLVGHERLAKLLSLYDVRTNKKELLRIFAAYPGVLELLPMGHGRSWLDHGSWVDLKAQHGAAGDASRWGVPDPAQLLSASETVARLHDIEKRRFDGNKPGALNAQWVNYVAGIGDNTPVAVASDGSGQLVFETTSQGDGRVPWSTGIPDNVRIHYMEANHGDLVAHRPAFAALRELITDGDTSRLSAQPPVMRSKEVRGRLGPDPDPIFPGEDTLIDAALGRNPSFTRREVRPKINIGVLTGSLAGIDEPVAVGHYQNEMLTGTECLLDAVRLDGMLSARHRLGRYPGRIGSAHVLLRVENNADSQRRYDGALVLGLGAVGTLDPGGLRRSMAAAVAELVLEVSERSDWHDEDDNGVREVCFTTLAIGAGHAGITIEDSVSAILRGIDQSADRLAERRNGRRVVVRRVRFVERYRDRADEIAHELRRITADGSHLSRFVVSPTVESVRGNLPGSGSFFDPEWWLRVRVSRNSDGGMKFLALTERARAETVVKHEQRRLVDDLLSKVTANTDRDDQLSGTLYELLLPNEFKDYAATDRNQLLVLDEDAARYPWELMSDSRSGEHEPPVTRTGLLRQLSLSDRSRTDVQIGGNDVLVVGDPDTNGTFSEPLPQLPGAESEAQKLIALFDKEGYAVNKSIKEGRQQVIQKLCRHDYRVMHLAGHGVFKFVDETEQSEYEKRRQFDPSVKAPSAVTGMVLNEGVFLSVTEIASVRRVPEMVFINCCHLGQLDQDPSDTGDRSDTIDRSNTVTTRKRNELAASLAKSIIQRGARAVVVAGWAVDDEAAEAFAVRYYEQMLNGEAFGTAVRLARKAAYDAAPGKNTWGAYQCYGSPEYRFNTQSSYTKSTGGYRIVSVNEAVRELEEVYLRSKDVSENEKKLMVDDILALEQRMPVEIQRNPQVLALRGRVNGEIERFDEAMALYSQALQCDRSDAPLDIIEQRENFRVRRFESQISSHRDGERLSANDLSTIKDSIDEAVQNVERLICFAGDSVERQSLIGSAGKRLAELDDNAGFLLMSRGYRRASELAIKQMDAEQIDRIDSYPLINWLFALAVLNHKKEFDRLGKAFRAKVEAEIGASGYLEGRLDEIVSRIHKDYGVDSTHRREFWDSVAIPALEFTKWVHDAVLAEAPKRVTKKKTKTSKKKRKSRPTTAQKKYARQVEELSRQYKTVLLEHRPTSRQCRSVQKNIYFAKKCFASMQDLDEAINEIAKVFDA